MKKEPTKETIRAWIQLHRAHRLLLEKVENSLKLEGLPPLGWYDVLLELYREKSLGLRQYEIGEKILLNKHNLSRLIDRLENKQLVERHMCTEDGRGNLVKITNKGKKVLKQVWPVYGQSIKENFGAKLNSTELIELSRILSQVLGGNDSSQ
ncbi:MAG: MarR family winged helix-turn-helix transcriptional regulator [Proteobacteria bacterium]|nr:MarR family winged helix-turn-helix transcriptional regulator [Pseudomonadota bacterium]